jgi:hypothetical protein
MHVNTRILMIMGLSASLLQFAAIATPAVGGALEAKVAIPKLVAFRDWLMSECSSTARPPGASPR